MTSKYHQNVSKNRDFYLGDVVRVVPHWQHSFVLSDCSRQLARQPKALTSFLEIREVSDELPGAPKLLITPIFPDFFRFFPVFPWTSGRVLWIPGVQTEKMGEKWGKMGKKWVKKNNYGG